MDDCRRRIQALETELGILDRETAVGLDHQARVAEIDEKLAKEKDALAGLEKHWNEEKELVGQSARPPRQAPRRRLGPDDARRRQSRKPQQMTPPSGSPSSAAASTARQRPLTPKSATNCWPN